jgi:hypothetical protein
MAQNIYKDNYGVEFTDDKKTLVRCPEDFEGEYVIPDGVIIIEACAFKDCKGLSSISIPNSVEKIEDLAFDGCKKLHDIIIGEEAFHSHGNDSSLVYVFGHQVTRITLKEGAKRMYLESFKWFENLKSITLPNSLEGVEVSLMFPDDIFAGCNKLKEIIIPKGQKEHFKEMFGLGWDHIAGGIVER